MSNTKEQIDLTMEWDELQPLLVKLGLRYELCRASDHLIKLVQLYDYCPQDISTYSMIDDEKLIGVVVTHINKDVDNGVYVFHASQSGRIMLSVLRPSTIDRQQIVNCAILNIETALSNADIPTLTPDDIVRTVYELLKRQICDTSAKAQQFPNDKQELYGKIYMDLLLHNLQLYHTQDDAYQENIINDQPSRIRTMLLHPELAEQISKQVMNDMQQMMNENEEPIVGTLPC